MRTSRTVRVTQRSTAPPLKHRDTIKLLMMGACALMGLAILVILTYQIFTTGAIGWGRWQLVRFWTPARPGPTTVIRNANKDVEAARQKGLDLERKARELSQSGREAEALATIKDAERVWNEAIELIDQLRQKPQYSGPEFAGWETTQGEMIRDSAKFATFRFMLERRLAQKDRPPAKGSAEQGVAEKIKTPLPDE